MGAMVLTMKQNKVSGVYKITNTITGDFYIGSSRNIKKRWTNHKSPSLWARHPNVKLYQAMVQFGLNNFKFEILEETYNFREREQYWIDQLNPSYNNTRANGFDIKRYKDYQKDYYNSNREKRLNKTREYHHKLCLYKGETLTLGTLECRFSRAGISHPTQEAKKYLLNE